MATTTPMGMVYQFSRRPRRPGSGPSDDPGAGEKTLACDQSLPLEETSFAAIVSPDTQERICLKCRRPFLSTWAGHRLCAACRFENSGIGMPNGVAPPRRRREEVSLDE